MKQYTESMPSVNGNGETIFSNKIYRKLEGEARFSNSICVREHMRLNSNVDIVIS